MGPLSYLLDVDAFFFQHLPTNAIKQNDSRPMPWNTIRQAQFVRQQPKEIAKLQLFEKMLYTYLDKKTNQSNSRVIKIRYTVKLNEGAIMHMRQNLSNIASVVLSVV